MNLTEVQAMYEEMLTAEAVPFMECGKCGKRFHMPRPFCPGCLSEDISVRSTRESGTVYAWTAIERGFNEPKVVVIVEYEGFRVKGNFVGPHDRLRICDKVSPFPDGSGSIAFRFTT